VIEKEFDKTFPARAITDLGRYEVVVKLLEDGTNNQPFRAKTLPPSRDRFGRKDRLIARSRERFTTPRTVVEERLHCWAGSISKRAFG
jgi:hypothetical protein